MVLLVLFCDSWGGKGHVSLLFLKNIKTLKIGLEKLIKVEGQVNIISIQLFNDCELHKSHKKLNKLYYYIHTFQRNRCSLKRGEFQ